MANEEQVQMLKQSVPKWNEWRAEHREIPIDLYRTDLSGANLSEANLFEADLSGANLVGVNLSEAHLTGARLIKAKLTRAKLSHAKLPYADLSDADLSNADLSDADLSNVDFSNANLSDANLSGAILFSAEFISSVLTRAKFSRAAVGETVFSNIDLWTALGLEEVHHLSSSIISTHTIQSSKGKIPTIFLRGCGLSDLEIESAKLAMPGLDPEEVAQITDAIHDLHVGKSVQYHSCFISYNNKDQAFAQRLHDDLQNKGVRCWYAPEDLKTGDVFRKTIGEQIRLREKLLVIISENSIQSEWVGDEVEKALKEEREQNCLKLFPIRLDSSVFKSQDDWAEKIQLRRHISDFSNWKDKSSYQKAFDRLLRDLKATEAKA
jgi:hypothetical protein